MAAITVTRTTRAGVEIVTGAASAAGDTCLNKKRVILKITHGGAGSRKVTIEAQRAVCGEKELHDIEIEMGAGETKYAGPFDRYVYNNADNQIELEYDDHSDLTIGALEVVNL